MDPMAFDCKDIHLSERMKLPPVTRQIARIAKRKAATEEAEFPSVSFTIENEVILVIPWHEPMKWTELHGIFIFVILRKLKANDALK